MNRRLSGRRLLTTVASLVLALPAFGQPVVESDFDDGPQGWVLTESTIWSATDGKPDGCIAGPIETPKNVKAEVRAPQEFLGDWSSYDGTYMVRFDYRRTAMGAGVNGWYPLELVLESRTGRARWQGTTIHALTPWFTVGVPIAQSFWVVELGNWSDILSNVESLQVAIETVSNDGAEEQNLLDNFAITPMDCPDACGDAFGVLTPINPRCDWSRGWRATEAGAFQLLPYYVQYGGASCPPSGCNPSIGWSFEGGANPSILHDLVHGRISMAPSSNLDVPNLRWTSPSTENFVLRTKFELFWLVTGADSEIAVKLNDIDLFRGTVDLNNLSVMYGEVLPLKAGDTIDIITGLDGTASWDRVFADVSIFKATDSPADVDSNGVVDLADAVNTIDCLGGPQASVATNCSNTDSDEDGDVDLLDFARIQQDFGLPCK